ncbi:uncharacterized protein M437DRAFT_84969 [Aureobasidium melanogenum CBS 110374]|uniref:Uncharacterized protein n=1 Tax=Aureobasidium melanogenum (strain CBS 110374) TaxID=1043003 RepID=A0A074VMV2_AURM1|nr:uncharacterized protein M437DRAFT_84969 [Aureobasidium melanogenum CBS 110374]KEQ62055.1 hypothetical protein M437DRAFT_84969 [Aureobasidium melanogenum CBS 110374]
MAASRMTTNKKEIMIYQGKLFETHYFGLTRPINWNARLCPALPLASGPKLIASVSRIANAHGRVYKRGCDACTSPEVIEIITAAVEVGEIDINSLGSLGESLLGTFDNIDRILHKPDFWAAYHALWDNSLTASAVILLRRFSSWPQSSVSALKSTCHTSATATHYVNELIEVCEFWLDRQSQKDIPPVHWLPNYAPGNMSPTHDTLSVEQFLTFGFDNSCCCYIHSSP